MSRSADATGQHERRLQQLAAVYLPLAAVEVSLSLRYGVGARPSSDPVRDLPLKGTALAPPLFLPAALVAGAALSRRPGVTGTTATTIAGAVGVAFTAGTTFNLRNDIVAARAAETPVSLTVGIAAFHWGFGPLVALSAFSAVRARRAGSPAKNPIAQVPAAPAPHPSLLRRHRRFLRPRDCSTKAPSPRDPRDAAPPPSDRHRLVKP